MDLRKETGKFGEDLAAEYLTKHGYKILDRNWRKRAGEIDIVAEKKDIIYFVEVRTKSSTQYGSPLESITAHKQAQIKKMALLYLQAHGGEKECVFMIASVFKNKCELSFVEDMF